MTDRQLDGLRDQILRQPNRTLLEANEAIQALFLKAQADVNEVTRDASTFYECVVQLAFDGAEVPAEHRESLKKLACGLVENLQETIGIIDFWRKPIKVKRLRGNIDTEILLAQGWTCEVTHGNNQS